MIDDYVFDPEALAIEIITSKCEEWGTAHLTVADWYVYDDWVVGFVANPISAHTYKAVFFNSIGVEDAYYSSDLLSECAQWAIPYINQLLDENNFTVITQDEPEKMLYRSLLVKKEKQDDPT